MASFTLSLLKLVNDPKDMHISLNLSFLRVMEGIFSFPIRYWCISKKYIVWNRDSDIKMFNF